MLFCFILHGFAFDYTDENGVTWDCWLTTSYDEETSTYKDYARLDGASNYGAEVVVPEKVYEGETAYTVISLYRTFQCSKVITKVTLPQNPIEIDGAFSVCENLAEVINSQYIAKCCNGAFNYTSLTSIDLSNCKYVGGFRSCEKLKTVTLKGCETIDNNAFENCTNLISIEETANVTSIGNEAFKNCSNLKKIDWTNVTTIGESAFEGTGVKELTLPTTITSIGKMHLMALNMLQSMPQKYLHLAVLSNKM